MKLKPILVSVESSKNSCQSIKYLHNALNTTLKAEEALCGTDSSISSLSFSHVHLYGGLTRTGAAGF